MCLCVMLCPAVLCTVQVLLDPAFQNAVIGTLLPLLCNLTHTRLHIMYYS